MPLLNLHSERVYSRQSSLIGFLPKRLLWLVTKGNASWFFALFLGALVPLSFAPFNTQSSLFSYLFFLPVSLFLYQCMHNQTAKEAFYKGWFFGIGLFAVGVSWMYVAIHDFGAAHWSLAVFFTGLFVLFISVYYGVFSWIIFKITVTTKTDESNMLLFYLPVSWVFCEWLRSWVLTGFPWLLSGYPMIETPLAGYAPIIGIYGLSLLAILLSTLLIIRLKAIVSLTGMGAVFVGGALLGQIQWSEPVGQALSVALIQGNVNQSVKWDRWQLEKTKQIYISLSRKQWQDNDLVIWPENAIPVFYHTLENTFYHDLELQAKKTDTELVTGLPVFDDDTEQYYNALTNLGGQQGYYYKTHLVPFGEYVPLAALIRGLVQFFNLPMSGFSAGEAGQSPVIIKGYKAVITLCYEDVFPQDMMSQISTSQFMINLSNNGWYGDSFAPHQHLEMARMRALETSRELIRSTTSGISALIDSNGHVMVRGPQFKQAVINGRIQPRMGTTPYVFWTNYPIIILFVIAVATYWWRQKK